MIGSTGAEALLALTAVQPALRADQTQESTNSLSGLTAGLAASNSVNPARANTYLLRDTIGQWRFCALCPDADGRAAG